jgi:hypothetical protein
MQQQGEDLLKISLEKSPWLPKSSKNACLYWADIYSKYLDNVRSVANQGFSEIERISSPSSKSGNKEFAPEATTKQTPTPRQTKKSPAVKEKTGNAEKIMAVNTPPAQKSVTKVTPTKKPITQSTQAEKLLTHDKPKEKKPDEVKAATPNPKPSVTSQLSTGPAPDNKESAKKPV